MNTDELGFRYIFAKLLAKKIGDYTLYVFRILEEETDAKYLVCTKCPNWGEDEIDIQQEGYLKYKTVMAYKDTWFNSKTFQEVPYKYSANYFYEFIPTTFVIAGKEIRDENIMIT